MFCIMSVYACIREQIIRVPFFKSIWVYFSYHIKRRRFSEKHDLIWYEDYRNRYPHYFREVLPQSQELVSKVRFVGEKLADYLVESTLSPVYLWELDDCTIIGESNVVIDSTGTAVFNHSSGMNVDHNDLAIISDRVYTRLGANRWINYYSIDRLNLIRCGISMVHPYHWNYFHFIIEVLPKFLILEKTVIPRSVPLIFDSCVQNIPQLLELIEIFNVENREVLFINRLEWRRVDKLYLISPVQRFPLNLIDPRKEQLDTFAYNGESIKWLRKRIFDFLGVTDNDNRDITRHKIFLSRKNGTRRPYNEADVWEVLKEFGYISVNTASMSIREQADLFSKADYIVSASGAALTNMIFCRPGTKILVLYSLRNCSNLFSSLAANLGLDLQFYIGIPENPKDVHTPFTIPKDGLRKAMNIWER